MATLMMFTVVILLGIVWKLTAGQVPGVSLLLKGTNYTNNSEILISEIGKVNPLVESDVNEALQCVTNKMPCCKIDKIGHWYFPSGMEVTIEGDVPPPFYRNRGNDGTINLNRANENVIAPTGQFCCVVPDNNDTNQTLCVNIVLNKLASTPYTLLNTLYGNSGTNVIGGSIAGAVAVSIIITIPATIVIFILVLRYCRKKRFPNEHKYPPSAARYTYRRNAGKQQSDSNIGNQCDDTKSPREYIYASVHRTVGKKCDFDAQSRTSTRYQNQTRTEQVTVEEEVYDDTINSGTGTKYQNQTRTKAVVEEEVYDDTINSGTGTKYQNQTRTKAVVEEDVYDDTINSGTGTKYQNQTRTKAVMEEECYDDIIKAGTGTRYQNQTHQTEGVTAEGYRIVAHQY